MALGCLMLAVGVASQSQRAARAGIANSHAGTALPGARWSPVAETIEPPRVVRRAGSLRLLDSRTFAGSNVLLGRYAVALATVVVLGAIAEPAHSALADRRTPLRVVLRGQRFAPAHIVATVGDSVRFELESGAPHNVAFDPDSIPSGALAPLARNLGTDVRNLFTPDMLLIPGESFVLSLAGLPPGTYPFFCAPHYAGGMRGELVVRAREP